MSPHHLYECFVPPAGQSDIPRIICKVLQAALNEIEQGRDEYAANASGLLSHMEQFETFFSLKLAHQIFSAAEQLSISLQAKDYTVQDAVQGASLLFLHLRSLRNEQRFNVFLRSG